MEYLCNRVETLQGCDVLQELQLHCDYSGSDVTILASYSLQDLYLPKMKNALFVALESRFSCAYATVYVHIG